MVSIVVLLFLGILAVLGCSIFHAKSKLLDRAASNPEEPQPFPNLSTRDEGFSQGVSNLFDASQ